MPPGGEGAQGRIFARSFVPPRARDVRKLCAGVCLGEEDGVRRRRLLLVGAPQRPGGVGKGELVAAVSPAAVFVKPGAAERRTLVPVEVAEVPFALSQRRVARQARRSVRAELAQRGIRSKAQQVDAPRLFVRRPASRVPRRRPRGTASEQLVVQQAPRPLERARAKLGVEVEQIPRVRDEAVREHLRNAGVLGGRRERLKCLRDTHDAPRSVVDAVAPPGAVHRGDAASRREVDECDPAARRAQPILEF